MDRFLSDRYVVFLVIMFNSNVTFLHTFSIIHDYNRVYKLNRLKLLRVGDYCDTSIYCGHRMNR